MTDKLTNAPRIQLHALKNRVLDSTGNKDGIPGNEQLEAGTTNSKVPSNPIAAIAKAVWGTGLSKANEARFVSDFVSNSGPAQRVTASYQLPKSMDGKRGLLEAQKAAVMVQFARPP